MALTKKRRYRNQTMRRQTRVGPGTRTYLPPPHLPVPTAVVHSGNDLTVTFDIPVVYTGFLPGWTNNSQTVASVAMTSPTVWVLTFTGATAAGATVVPQWDKAFRGTPGGGFVQSGTYTAT